MYCTVNFENNPQRVFYSGDVIRGTVKLTLINRKKIRGVYIRFSGDANTEWYIDVKETEGTGENQKTVTVRKRYRSHQDHLYSKTFLIGSNDGELYLEAGEHVYGFQCELPSSIPSSFKGTYGNIKYGAKVVVIIPWGINNSFQNSFTVIRSLDLNFHPHLQSPRTDSTEYASYKCCLLCCFPSDPLRIIPRIPVGGYAPGQLINLTLEVDNKSDERIPQIQMELVKHVWYHAEGDTKTEKFYRKGEESTLGVEVNQKRIIHINLQVPPNPPSDEETCRIIRISYYVQIRANVESCCRIDPTIKIPIIIGTKPINDFNGHVASGFDPSAPPPSSSHVITIQPSAPPKNAMPNGENSQNSAPAYPEDELPTYEECLDAKGSSNNDNFEPKYPFYRSQTSYAKY